MPAVRVGTRPVRSAEALAKADEALAKADLTRDGALLGATIKRDVATIVGFATAARTSKEVGNGQMWGRIAGFPSSDRTVAWALDQFRKAGIADLRSQPIEQDAKSSLWLPLSWQVRLLADPAFGLGSVDVVLESALPVGPSNIP